MPPRRPRRRARRRSSARPMILLIAAVVVLAIVVGGLTQVSRQSTGYDANSDRTLAAQGTVAADQSNATAATVRKVVNDLPSQTRQGLQAALDGAVLQTSDEAARAAARRRVDPVGQPWRPSSPPFRGAGASRGGAAGRRRTGSSACNPSLRPTLRRAARRRPRAGPPSCRPPRPRTASPPPARSCRMSDALYRSVQRSLAAGRRPREAAAVGLGDPPAGVATGQRGGPGRSRRHLLDAGGDALRRAAHGAPESSRPAHAARAPRRRVGDQPDLPDRRDRGPGQPGLVERSRMSRSASRWPIRPRARRRPRSGRRRSPWAPRSRCPP